MPAQLKFLFLKAKIAEKFVFRLIFYLFCIILKYEMALGNLFSAAALAESVYLPMLHKGANIPVVSKAKKNEFPGWLPRQ
jgi:hypothetical protein